MKQTANIKNKITVLVLLLLFANVDTFGQAIANYSYTTNTTGSLNLDKNGNTIDMSSGSTQLIGASTNSVSTILLDIGFDFYYMGVRTNKYNVTSHGLFGLFTNTGTPVGTGNNIAGGTGNRLGAFVPGTIGTNMATHSTGKVHSKVFGTFPNRVRVIEWFNMSITSTSTTADATFQARLYENGGTIEYAYGAFAAGNAAAVGSVKTGFSTTAAIYHNVDYATMASSTTVAANNTINTGVITAFNSSSDGNRRIIQYQPSTVNAPTALTFTPVGASTMTLNWVDNATNELGYGIYRSDDGGTTYSFVTSIAANSTSYVASGLIANTNYYWRIAAYAEAKSDYLAGNQSTISVSGTITSTSTGGLWSQTSTWVGGVVPTGDFDVQIANGATVTIDQNAGAYNLTVGEGASGTLIFETTTARTLTIGKSATISTGATLSTASTGTVTTHLISIAENLTNNGTLDLSTNTNTAGAELRFAGIANSAFTGTGATNDLFLLTVNKPIPTGIVSTTSPTLEISVAALTGKGASAAFVNVATMNGIIKFSGTATISNPLFSAVAYTVPITGGIWLNNPNQTITGLGGSPIWNGLLRVSAGTFNAGTASGNQLSGGAGATYIFEGGTANFSGRFLNSSAINLTISGGTLNICTVGNTSASGSFSFASTASIVNISGGTINLVKASTATTKLDYTLAGLVTITGGVLNVNGTAATTYTINGNVPNIVVSNNCTAKLSSTLNVYGNITTDVGTTIDAATFGISVWGQSVTNPGNVINNGSIINSPPTTAGTNNTNRLQISGTFGAQTISGTGSIGTAATTYSGLSLVNASGVTVSCPVYTNRVNLFSGTLTNATNISIGNNYVTPVLATIQVGGNSAYIQGSMGASAPIFNTATSNLSILYSVGASNIVTGNEIPSSRSVTSLTLSNTNLYSVTLAGGNLNVSGTLTCSAGNMILDGNDLTATTISGGSVNSHIVTNSTGKLISSVSSTAVTFPVGSTTAMYDPVVLTENGGAPNTYEVKVSNGAVINSPSDPTKTVEKNWDISKMTANTSNVNMTLTYDVSSVLGSNFNPSNPLVVGHYNTTTSRWEEFVATGAGTSVSATGITSFSPFAIGNATALPIDLISFTAKKANNNVTLNWATATERNNEKFEILRSIDGINFSSIAYKKAKGNSTKVTTYDYLDTNAPFGTIFYQLKQIDIDGRTSLSKVISINNNDALSSISIYPNPVQDVLKINTKNSNQPVSILDFNGKVVLQYDSIPNSIDINDLPKGMYFIKTETESIKLLKN